MFTFFLFNKIILPKSVTATSGHLKMVGIQA